MSKSPLLLALIELASELGAQKIKLILAGGYGLYLKQLQMQSSLERTLINSDNWTQPRSTIDLDIFLETELVTSLSDMQALRSTIDKLGYKVIEKAKFMHFARGEKANAVEINLLTGPIEKVDLKDKVKISKPRVRPHGDIELHAYLTEEAIDLSSNLEEFLIGDSKQIKIFLPLSFHFLLMKLHAFNDRMADQEKQRTHALDVYRIIAMLTEPNYKDALQRSKKYVDAQKVKDAIHIVKANFNNKDSLGVLRIREHQLYHESFDIMTCLDALKELFH